MDTKIEELKDRYTDEQLDDLVRDCVGCNGCDSLEEHISNCLAP